MKTKLALVGLALACCAGLLWTSLRPANATLTAPSTDFPERGTPSARGGPAADAPPVTDPSVATAPERRAGAGDTAWTITEPVESAAAPEPRTLYGQVVDPEVRPLGDVEITFSAHGAEAATTTSGPDGRFRLPAARVAGHVEAVDDELENLFVFRPRPDALPQLMLVVAAHRPLAGTVRNEEGRPVPGVHVAFELPRGFGTRFDAVLDAAEEVRWTATTDDDGRFALPRAPVVEGARVEARLEGYRTASLEPPRGPFDGLELLLVRPNEEEEGMLVGRVSDANGDPAAGARVSWGHRVATTADDGTIRILRHDREDENESAEELVAVRHGSTPARLRPSLDPVTGAPAWPDWIELQLGGDPLRLAGRVVDEEGRPRANIRVWLTDPTFFGTLDDDNGAQLEILAASRDAADPDDEGELDTYFRTSSTDDDGRFSIDGLWERDYTLGLLDTGSLARQESGPFSAGDESITVVFPHAELAPLRGRLLSEDGMAVEGAQLTLHVHQRGGVHHAGQKVVTDALGDFEFDPVGAGPFSVWARGDEILPAVLQLPRGDEPAELRVERLCHFKIDASGQPSLADAVRVLDAEGSLLSLQKIGAGGWMKVLSAPLTGGRSAALGVSARATTIVLLANGQEVRRLAFFPAVGDLQILKP